MRLCYIFHRWSHARSLLLITVMFMYMNILLQKHQHNIRLDSSSTVNSRYSAVESSQLSKLNMSKTAHKHRKGQFYVSPMQYVKTHQEIQTIYNIDEEDNDILVPGENNISLGLGLAIKYGKDAPVDHMLFFNLFLNSFCSTASTHFRYHFYLAYDHTDKFFNSLENRKLFRTQFDKVTQINCTQEVSKNTFLHWVSCAHAGQPARCQNEAMMAGYYDNHEYYFRVVDDSVLKTSGWTEALITALQCMHPPNVGLVAPNITRAPKNLLTFEFVHRTHFEIFGYFYPYVFRHWWGDTWMNHVYEPHHKKTVQQVSLI